MSEKLFTLSRTQREDMWRRFKQSDDRRITERLHAILLLGSGQNTAADRAVLEVILAQGCPQPMLRHLCRVSHRRPEGFEQHCELQR